MTMKECYNHTLCEEDKAIDCTTNANLFHGSYVHQSSLNWHTGAKLQSNEMMSALISTMLRQ